MLLSIARSATVFIPIQMVPETLTVFTVCSASAYMTRVTIPQLTLWGSIIPWQLPMRPLRQIHWPWVQGLNQVRRLSIKLEVSRRLPEADSFPICKLSVFIYLPLNDPRFNPRGHFFSVSEKQKQNKKRTMEPFFCWSFVTSFAINVMDWNNFEWKVVFPLEMNAFGGLPLNTNKCLCLSCPLRHTWTHIFVTPAFTSPPLLPSSLRSRSHPALIRVMPNHHSTIWARLDNNEMRVMRLHTVYSTACS